MSMSAFVQKHIHAIPKSISIEYSFKLVTNVDMIDMIGFITVLINHCKFRDRKFSKWKYIGFSETN